MPCTCRQDGPRGEVPAGWRVLFRAAFLRTTRAPFSARGSLVTYAVFRAGCPWMTSWQDGQTVRVLRRICAIFAAQAGWPGPGSPRLASLRTWCTSTLPASPHSSHRRFRSRWISSFRGPGTGLGPWSCSTAFFLPHQRDPAEPGYQVRLAVTLDPGFEAGTQPAGCLDLGFVLGRDLRHRGLVLGRQGFQHGCLGVPAQRAEPPDVAGELVVADDAPVFSRVCLDDVVVAQVLHGGPVPGFAVAPVGGSFRLDHIEWHAQRDDPVGRTAAPGDLAVGVLDDDLVAEVPGRPGAGMGDQRLIRVEFECEFAAQEPCQLILDVRGFGFWSGEPQEMIVGLCRHPGYADRTAGGPAWRAGHRFLIGITRRVLAAARGCRGTRAGCLAPGSGRGWCRVAGRGRGPAP